MLQGQSFNPAPAYGNDSLAGGLPTSKTGSADDLLLLDPHFLEDFGLSDAELALDSFPLLPLDQVLEEEPASNSSKAFTAPGEVSSLK